MVQFVFPQHKDVSPRATPASPDITPVDGFGDVCVSTLVDDGESTDTWVQLLPWAEFTTKPNALARYDVMRRSLGSLISIDTPGLGDATTALSPGLRHDIRGGRLDAVADIQWEALRQTSMVMPERISLLGYSMGTALVSAFLRRAPAEVAIERVALIEPVASLRQPFSALAAKFLRDGKIPTDDPIENPEWYASRPSPWPPQVRDLYTYAAMIARGGQFDDVSAFDDVPTTVISGERSLLSPLPVCQQLARRLHAEHVVVLGENHGMIDRLGRVAWLSQYLTEEFGDTDF